jgi:hypothetical protein
MSYALYKFHKAILSLYGTDLQKKQWLASSYMHHIVHLRDVDLPEPLREEFQELRSCLVGSSESMLDATLEDTVKMLNNNEVNIIIDRIVVMYDLIRRYEGMSLSP